MIHRIEIEEAKTRLDEIVSRLNPSDVVVLVRHEQELAQIIPSKAPIASTPGDDWSARFDKFLDRQRGLGSNVDVSRESIYD